MAPQTFAERVAEETQRKIDEYEYMASARHMTNREYLDLVNTSLAHWELYYDTIKILCNPAHLLSDVEALEYNVMRNLARHYRRLLEDEKRLASENNV